MNWIELYETNDLIHLSRTGKICKRATHVFETLQGELIDKFGTSADYLRQHQLRMDLELMRCEMMHTGDSTLQFHIEMAEAELEKMADVPERKVDMPGSIVWLKKNHININPNQDTVYWYYEYMKSLTDEIAKKNVRK